MENNNPIGIFDSGIGGLSVANAIIRALPNDKVIYFGDTAHLPYGDKSSDLIKEYSLRISDYLINKHKCKAIVIACNTASAAAYEHLRDAHKGEIPIINVIDPIIEAIVEDDAIKRVGIIATQSTIASGTYQEKLKRRKPSLAFSALATPLLVPMIEEGFANNQIREAIIHEYLQRPELQNIDALILGCTHYVMIKKEINAFYEGKVKLFDSTNVTARKLKSILEKENLMNDTKNILQQRFFVSDLTPSFIQTAKIFYPHQIEFNQIKL